MTRLPILLACLPLALFAASCGDDEEQETAATPSATAEATAEAPPEPTAEPTSEAAGGIDPSTISKKLSKKPEVAKPEGSPPAELVTEDIVEGKGRTAKAGDVVAMQYVGNSWSTGAQFDASWDRGAQPFEFALGAGQVIPGWDEGIAGMKEGGRRLLVIPPDLGYGPQGSPPVIAPNETLIFVVDLEKVKG
jgi:peptidylprolyl isomerase